MSRVANKVTSILGMTLVVAMLTAGPADARRNGSFGSRGARTYAAPPPTKTSPAQTAPVQRTMTQPPKAAQPAATPGAPAAAAGAAQAPRRGFLGGMGGGILGGLVAGGLIGAMLGNGFGGLGAGMANTLMQIALIGGVALLVMMFLRRRRAATAAANGPAAFQTHDGGFGRNAEPEKTSGSFGGFQPREVPPAPAYEPQAPVTHEIGLLQSDRDAFERLLSEIQDAFAREDYAALRERTTPEVMSYLSEELSQNATQGRRNDVSGTRLLQADIAEAWQEADGDYATAAMRYEGIDIMRDRQSGAVLSGDPEHPTETTELWTFVRRNGGDWKLSAIQEA